MANTPSNMIPLGTKSPDFNLPDTISGNTYSLNNLKGDKATVIMFICNHCPFVKHINNQLVLLASEYKLNGVSFIAISSNDAMAYPQDGPELMKKNARENSYNFPYLYDQTQQTAIDYDAACTPDFYIFDHTLSLVYRGQLDDSRPGNSIPVTGRDIRMALNNLLENRSIDKDQKPSLGCNIKWKI